MQVCISLACFLGQRHIEAAIRAHSGDIEEPLFGKLSTEHIQLVPQSSGILTIGNVSDLQEAYPSTKFRLHANVRVLDEHVFADLSTFHRQGEWFDQAASLSRRMNAPAYSLHSGRRCNATMSEMLDNRSRVEDLFGCPVAVEGQYPDQTNSFLVSTWEEYAQLLDARVPFALDLSHLNILAFRSKQMEEELIQEMLASEFCIEIHVSDNDGMGDQHQIAQQGAWWLELLSGANPDAVIFSEGNHQKPKRAMNSLETESN